MAKGCHSPTHGHGFKLKVSGPTFLLPTHGTQSDSPCTKIILLVGLHQDQV